MQKQPNILPRMYILGVSLMLFAAAILYKLIHISLYEAEGLRDKSEKITLSYKELHAERGNIYSSDRMLLATSMPVYDLYFDALAPDQEAFNKDLEALSAELTRVFPEKTKMEWLNYLKQGRKDGNRYIKIGKNVSYSQLQKIRKFPIIEKGRYKGGLIAEQRNFRKKPLGGIAERTIGYDLQDRGQAGLEGAYSSYLRGKDGKRLMQQIAKGNWKPLPGGLEIEPYDGYDLMTTIDSRMQDIVHRELLNTLLRYKADHGTVVLMEVQTGNIRAIANIGRNKNGSYSERLNYAVGESTEPGSTFKLFSMMALLEDKSADTSDLVDTQNGIWEIFGEKVKDSNVKNGVGGYGVVSLARAFEQSSNVGIAKVIYEKYGRQPQRFVDRLYTIGLNKPLGLEILGEGKPVIKRPGDRDWSATSLPWMSFGYETQLTPLQILTYYNAVANDGVMLKPRFVTHVSKNGQTLKEFKPEVLNPAICSKETNRKLQALLRGAVENGTARNINYTQYPISGKTGTCQIGYGQRNQEGPNYQASFAGYFPANKPQYSIIVVVSKPNVELGYYGSTVAAPVAGRIAELLYALHPEPVQPVQKVLPRTENRENLVQHLEKEIIPNLKELPVNEVLASLENHGYTVHLEGEGFISAQYPAPGSHWPKNRAVHLKLMP